LAQRMTMTTTNVEILRQGWLDAASALAPGLETLPESLENGLDAAVVDERLDEQSAASRLSPTSRPQPPTPCLPRSCIS